MSDPLKININLTPEDINKYVSETIMNSSIGAILKKQLEDFSKRYNFERDIEYALSEEIQKIIRVVIQSEYRDKIVEVTKKFITDDFIAELADKIKDKIYISNS